MRVEVDLTLKDFRALGRAAVKRSKALPRRDTTRWRRAIEQAAVAVIALVLTLVAAWSSNGEFGDHIPLGVATGLTFAIFVMYFAFDAQRRVSPSESGPTLGPRTFELTDEGIVETSRYQEFRMYWSGVHDLVETPEHIFLLVDRCGGFIVPKRFFDSPDRASEFKAYAEQRIRPAA